MTQCDLFTEHYEKLLTEERHRGDLLQESLSQKVTEIADLTTSLADSKSNFDIEVNALKHRISELQVKLNLMNHFNVI